MVLVCWRNLVVSLARGVVAHNLFGDVLSMNITVRYFASMRDKMGRADESLVIDGDTASVADIWSKVTGGQAIPDSTLIAINMEYTDADAKLKDGDELAFFPPVTGG